MAKTPPPSGATAAPAPDATPEAPTVVAPQPSPVVCLVRAPAGPRRRAGFAFGPEPRPLTRAELGGTDEAIKATLAILAADPKLSLLAPT